MGKKKEDDEAYSRFEVGSHGGCEASLFEFSEGVPHQKAEAAVRESLQLLEKNTVRIAAATFDEALTYLRWSEPRFKIESVQNLGVIILVSGSPVD